MFCLREPREIHREVIHGMDSLPDDERSSVDEPDASVDLVGNIRDPACGVRRAQGDGHRGHEPTVRARGSRQGGGRRRGNRIDRDGPRLRQLHEPCHVGCVVFDEMHAIGQGERPSARTKGPAYALHGPPSIRYVLFDTPLVASVALRYTVTAETNQPLLPGVPDSDAVVTGATVSTFTVRDFVVSVSPALSVALYSARCSPSPRTKVKEEAYQRPPPTRDESA